jgi:predicted nucleotidyltransferase
MQLSSDQLQAIKAWADSHACIKEVRLFGSRFKGTARSDSDVDLAVTIAGYRRGLRMTTPQDIYLTNAHQWEDELTPTLGVKADIERYEKETAPKVWSYVQEGSVLIYPWSR